jgi:hypothetical protein
LQDYPDLLVFPEDGIRRREKTPADALPLAEGLDTAKIFV